VLTGGSPALVSFLRSEDGRRYVLKTLRPHPDPVHGHDVHTFLGKAQQVTVARLRSAFLRHTYGAVRFVGRSRGCVATAFDFKEGTDVASLLAGDPLLAHRLTAPLIAFLEELLASGYGVRLSERDDCFMARAHVARLTE